VDWGLFQWLKPLLDIMMSGVSETVDCQLGKIYDAIGCPDQYLRLEQERLPEENADMDDADKGNMAKLEQIGLELARAHDDALNDFVKLLL
jgi:hypothetical protein